MIEKVIAFLDNLNSEDLDRLPGFRYYKEADDGPGRRPAARGW